MLALMIKLIAVMSLVVFSPRAHAQTLTGWGNGDDLRAFLIGTTVVVGASVLALETTFITADTIALGEGRDLDSGWSVAQLVVGLLHLSAGAALIGHTCHDVGWQIFGWVTSLWGAWLTGFAIASMAIPP
jgi:hypothetical protein